MTIGADVFCGITISSLFKCFINGVPGFLSAITINYGAIINRFISKRKFDKSAVLFSYKLDIMNVPFYMFLAYPNRRDISGLILRFSHIILILDVLKNGKTRVEN